MDIKSLPLAELRRRLLRDPGTPSRRVLEALRDDPRAGARELHQVLTRRLRQRRRAGARELHQVLTRRLRQRRKEARRFEALFRHERDCWSSGARRVAGVDEAGMGPLAGPVVAAAVVFEPGARIPGVDDSKVLDADTREQLAGRIRETAIGVGVGLAEVAEIDRLNVFHAGLLAMGRALASLPEPADAVLVDARTVPGVTVPQHAVPRGDSASFTIACASIIAKTHRDALMRRLDAQYPGYGFAAHKGYATPAHRDALAQLGPCNAHRASWACVRDVGGEFDGDYYGLKQLVEAAEDEASVEVAAQCVSAARDELHEDEHRRLKQLLARRRQRLRPGR